MFHKHLLLYISRACHVPHSTVFMNCTKGLDRSPDNLAPVKKSRYQRPRLYDLTMDDLRITPSLRGVKIQMADKLKVCIAL